MATAARDLPDWGGDPPTYPLGKRIWLFVVLAGPLVLVSAALSFPFGGGWVGFALTLTIVSMAMGVYVGRLRKQILKRFDAVPLDESGARFRNLVEGLAEGLESPRPEIFLVTGDKPNAIVLRGHPPVIGVTRSLLDTYSRTEQEAVAAHCLVRIHTGHLFFSELAARLGRSASRFAPKVGSEDDLQTAAITRYPPGLARAIQHAGPVQGPTACLWFVAHSPSHYPVVSRIDALGDL